MDRRPRMANVIVTGGMKSGGLVDIAHDVTLQTPTARFSGSAAL